MDKNSITDRMCLLYCRCSADVQRMGKRRKAYAETYDLNAMSGSAKKEDGNFHTGKDKT